MTGEPLPIGHPPWSATICDLTLTGEPEVKQRPRFARGKAYTPAATVAAEEAIRWQLRAAGVKPEVRLPVEVFVRFRCSAGARRGRRDVDNLVKCLLDACNGFAWVDDSQVAHIDAWLERGSSRPGTDLRITRYHERTLR